MKNIYSNFQLNNFLLLWNQCVLVFRFPLCRWAIFCNFGGFLALTIGRFFVCRIGGFFIVHLRFIRGTVGDASHGAHVSFHSHYLSQRHGGVGGGGQRQLHHEGRQVARVGDYSELWLVGRTGLWLAELKLRVEQIVLVTSVLQHAPFNITALTTQCGT